MIRLLCGPAGSGKSALLLERIRAVLAAGGQAVLLVPEQEAVAREREALAAIEPSAQLRFEVFNFSRLANHAFRRYGGLSYRGITPGGRALTMWRTLRALSPFLTEYGERAQNDAALTALMRSAVAECKAYAITPKRLEDAAAALPRDSALGAKLRDLALVYAGYTARVAERYDDGEDDLCRLAKLLEKHSLLADAEVFVDSFTSFTAAELDVLTRIMVQAKETTFSLCCDRPGGNALHFTEIYRTAAALRRIAARADLPLSFELLEGSKRAASPLLAELPAALWSMEHSTALVHAHTDNAGEVELYSCASPFAEAEAAVSRISALVKDGGMRYRDIVLVVRDTDRWRGILDAELERAGIPYFLSQRTDITTKPVVKLLLAALALRAGNWRQSDLLTYLKTGYSGLRRREVDLLEDYITRWQLSGKAFTDDTPWTMNPDGYVGAAARTERQVTLLAKLNELRMQLISPLRTLFSAFDGANDGEHTAAKYAAAIYAFLVQINLPGQLQERVALERERGNIAEAAELIQLWNITLGALDQLVEVFGDEPLEEEDFAAALRLLFAETDIGTIPTSADQVTIGSAAMLRANSPRCVILLGLCAGEFPQAVADSGFFSGADRQALEALGLSLAPGGERRAAEELFYVYRAVSSPRERLICLYSRADTDGKETLPSLAMSRLSLLLGRAPEEWEKRPLLDRLWSRESAFPYAAPAESGPVTEALRALYAADPNYSPRLAALDMPITERKCRLSPEMAQALFGERMQLSQSRVDSYVGCPFAYFCRYLLNLRDEEPAQIGYDNVGTYVHAVLERFFASLTEDGVLHLPASEDELVSRLDAVIAAYLDDLFTGVPASARTAHLFSRLRRLARLLIDNLLAEFRQSSFVPVLFELPIRRGEPGSPEPLVFDLPDGTPVWLTGIIDRVDLWRTDDGRCYLRVVDYKTGSKAFNRADLDVGYNLQLLLYLFTLCRSRSPELRVRLGLPPDTPLEPAGMLYCAALAPDLAVSADTTAEEIVAAADAKLARRGIVLDDETVLRAMDSSLSGKYIPCRLTRSGSLTSPEARATAEEFDALYLKLATTIRRVAGELRAGCANASPRRREGIYPCQNCPAKPVCRAEKR